jgi:hypothetical protein
MTALAFILLLIGFLAAAVASIWMIVNAFRVSVLWGIVVFLFGPAWLVFCFKHWDMARRPLYCLLIGCGLCAGPFLLFPAKDREAWTQTVANRAAARANSSPFSFQQAEPKKPSSIPAMFAAQKQMELQIRLVALQKRENDLLDRKAGLDPKDRQGAIALTAEIKKYNDDLKPVLQQMRDHGMVAAQ